MRLTTGFENKKARIEIVNLIDIAFLILVFFIYAALSMSLSHGLKVSLPTSALGHNDPATKVQVQLRADNTLWLNGLPVALDECIRQVSNQTRDTRASVLISGDRQAELGAGIELLSRLKEAGIPAVAFEVKKP